MNESQTPTPILFLDFDGTISRRDAVDVILETYADEKWKVFEDEWRAGLIGSRDCLFAQMALVRATRSQLNALIDQIEIDEGLVALLETCAVHRVPAHIISDGFDYCIRQILANAEPELSHLLRGVRVCASHLEPSAHHWRIDFPFFHQACAHGCATCKPAVMRLLNRANAPIVFVGDGLSDRYAAESADLVFAKTALAAHCREQQIAHSSYERLADVALRLDEALRRGLAFAPKELSVRVGA